MVTHRAASDGRTREVRGLWGLFGGVVALGPPFDLMGLADVCLVAAEGRSQEGHEEVARVLDGLSGAISAARVYHAACYEVITLGQGAGLIPQPSPAGEVTLDVPLLAMELFGLDRAAPRHASPESLAPELGVWDYEGGAPPLSSGA